MDPRGELDWKGVLDAFGDAVIAADRDGRVGYSNAAVEKLLGWSPADLLGQPLVVLMPERMRSVHEAGFQRYLATGRARLIGRSVRVPALHKDGTEVDVELSLTTQRSGGRETFVASLRDLRDRVELERQLAATRYLAAATQAAARLAERLELDPVLEVAVSTLDRDFGAALAGLWLHDPATSTLELRASTGISTRVLGATRERIAVASHLYEVGVVARTLRPFVRNGLAGAPGFEQDWMEREGLRSVTIFPLVCGGALRGVLGAFFRRRLEDEVLEVLGTFSALVASAIENTRLYATAQDAIRARDEFLSIASHELRTPLAPLSLNLESLLRTAERSPGAVPKEKVRAKVQSARRALSHLERLVTRMLDVSRVQEQGLELDLEAFDLVALLQETIERHQPELDALGCELRLTTPDAVVGVWDRLRLDDVIANLLSNAAKFGRTKPIEVILLSAHDEVVVTVRDHGIGISAEDQAKLFGRFARVASDSQYGGFGLGLWLANEFVRAMGGTMKVESAPGRGAAFTVRLPREVPPADDTRRGAA